MFRSTNVLLDQCSVDESALDERVVEKSIPQPVVMYMLPDIPTLYLHL